MTRRRTRSSPHLRHSTKTSKAVGVFCLRRDATRRDEEKNVVFSSSTAFSEDVEGRRRLRPSARCDTMRRRTWSSPHPWRSTKTSKAADVFGLKRDATRRRTQSSPHLRCSAKTLKAANVSGLRQRTRQRPHASSGFGEGRGEELESLPLHYLLDWDRQGRATSDRKASRFSRFSLFFERRLLTNLYVPADTGGIIRN